ncbi:hypothetical protein V8E53_015020 [Lactarius tabidus]
MADDPPLVNRTFTRGGVVGDDPPLWRMERVSYYQWYQVIVEFLAKPPAQRICSDKASTGVKKDQQGRACNIGDGAGEKASGHGNGGPTSVPKVSSWPRPEKHSSSSCWIEPFQKHVNDFIQERLAEAAKIMAVLGKELEDAIQLHCLWHLIAGAIQEEELVQQPDYAFTYAKLDRAIIWDG